MLGFWTSSQQLGSIVGTLLTTFVSTTFGWRAAFVLAAVVSAVAGVAVYKWLPEPSLVAGLGISGSAVVILPHSPNGTATHSGSANAGTSPTPNLALQKQQHLDGQRRRAADDQFLGLPEHARLQPEPTFPAKSDAVAQQTVGNLNRAARAATPDCNEDAAAAAETTKLLHPSDAFLLAKELASGAANLRACNNRTYVSSRAGGFDRDANPYHAHEEQHAESVAVAGRARTLAVVVDATTCDGVASGPCSASEQVVGPFRSPAQKQGTCGVARRSSMPEGASGPEREMQRRCQSLDVLGTENGEHDSHYSNNNNADGRNGTQGRCHYQSWSAGGSHGSLAAAADERSFNISCDPESRVKATCGNLSGRSHRAASPTRYGSSAANNSHNDTVGKKPPWQGLQGLVRGTSGPASERASSPAVGGCQTSRAAASTVLGSGGHLAPLPLVSVQRQMPEAREFRSPVSQHWAGSGDSMSTACRSARRGPTEVCKTPEPFAWSARTVRSRSCGNSNLAGVGGATPDHFGVEVLGGTVEFARSMAHPASQNGDGTERPTKQRYSSGTKPLSFFQVLRIPDLLACGQAYFCVKLVRYALLFWLPFFLRTELHFGEAAAGYSSLLFDIGGVVGSVTAGYASEQFFAGQQLAAATVYCAASAAALLAFSATTSLVNSAEPAQSNVLRTIALLLIGLEGFFIAGPDSILGGSSAAEVCDRSNVRGAHRSLSTATGIVNGLGAFGGVVQGTLTAVVSESLGWSSLFVFLAVVALCGAASLWRLSLDSSARTRVATAALLLSSRFLPTKWCCRRQSRRKNYVAIGAATAKGTRISSNIISVNLDQDIELANQSKLDEEAVPSTATPLPTPQATAERQPIT